MSANRKPTKSLFVIARIPQNLHRSKGAFARTYNYFAHMYGKDVVDAVVEQVAPGHMASAKLRRIMRKFLGKSANLRGAMRLARHQEQVVGLTVRLADGRLAVFAPLAPKALHLTHRSSKKSAA